MIRYFNPGHEAAVWADSPFYQPPTSVLKLQKDLAFLPFYYADLGDYVYLPGDHYDDPIIQSLYGQTVDFWGLSKSAIHLFEQFSEKYDLNLVIPKWSDRYKSLTSREFSASCLAALAEEIPGIAKDIIPVFYSDLSEIEYLNRNTPDQLLLKSPYSSSGRGLLWLEKPELSRSSRQIIAGMLKKQGKVSVEKVLKKGLDFSMQFDSDKFLGYSIFHTNSKGAYNCSYLASQERMEIFLSDCFKPGLFPAVIKKLQELIRERILPYYSGNIGVDMMIYIIGEENDKGECYFLHPCVEMNLRKSMGYVSLKIFERMEQPDWSGYFTVKYNAKNPDERFIDLCPVHPDTKFRAIVSNNILL